MAAPTAEQYQQLYDYARSFDLTRRAAQMYAALGWWGLHYQLAPLTIVSGKRSSKRQLELQRRWDAGDRAGLKVRPVTNSSHITGEAFDVAGDPWTLQVWGFWAPYAGGRWGGTFSTPDPVHFDVRGT